MEERRAENTKVAVLEVHVDNLKDEVKRIRVNYHELISGPITDLLNDGIRREEKLKELNTNLGNLKVDHEFVKNEVVEVSKKVERVLNKGIGLWLAVIILFEFIKYFYHK